MNYFYLAKKSNYYASWLNIIGTLSWIILTILIYYYHHYILLGTSVSKYSYLTSIAKKGGATAGSSDISPVNNVDSNLYPWAFITSEGYGKFFSKTWFSIFSIQITYWTFIYPLFLITIICYSLKSIMCIYSIVATAKFKSMLYLYASIANFFVPFLGGCVGIYVKKSNEKMIYKKILPCQWIKFQIKKWMAQFFSEPGYTKI